MLSERERQERAWWFGHNRARVEGLDERELRYLIHAEFPDDPDLERRALAGAALPPK